MVEKQAGDNIFLEMLHNIQMTYGYIPEGEINRLAEKLDRPRAEIYGAIKFYSMFYTEPTGKYIIRICDSLSCHLQDSHELLQSVQSFLDLDDGETSPDQLFTLEVVECLGHCGEGPVMMINDRMYTELTTGRALDIIKQCK